MRPEIQALRAAAVLSVVLYHLWPNRLPGGFVGVDVFFAISGFLITDHLLREARETGRIQILRFWARRIRRLLPASLLVLVTTALAVVIFVPRALWDQFLTAVLAAVFYAENWLLAAQAVDYLAAENVVTPVQHFWSLGVEEQFYLAWPVLVALVWAGARATGRSGKSQSLIVATLSAVFLISLGASVVISASSPSLAYFATYIRAWEFAAGALIAAIVPRALPLTSLHRAALAWVGWGMIAASLLLFTGATPFPSGTALLPVGGALLVIAAGEQTEDWSPTQLIRFRPVQLIGNWSYSIYLWHWPLIVIVPFVTGHPLGLRSKLAILVVAFIAAAATKRWVEDAFRPDRKAANGRARRAIGGPALGRVFIGGLIGMVIAAALPSAGLAYVRVVEERSATAANAASAGRCFGASAIVHADCRGAHSSVLLPDPAAVFDDTDEAFKCYRQEGAEQLHKCSFGSERSDATRVALTGDSHAAMLVPGLRSLMERQNWRLDVYVGWGGYWRDPASAEGADRSYLTKLDQALNDGHYDVILTTAHRQIPISDSSPRIQEAMKHVWKRAQAAGSRVIAIQDNPQIGAETVQCITRLTNSGAQSDHCGVSSSAGLGGVDNVARAAQTAGIPLISTTSFFCEDDRCPAVIGGVIVYRDEHHITATYSKSLAPFLIARIKQELTSN